MARGKKTGGGSRKGVPNKVTTELRSMILGALEAAGGQKYLQDQATENAPAFLALLGKTLPKDINLGGEAKLKVTLVGVKRGA
jgi:hypothetical protein